VLSVVLAAVAAAAAVVAANIVLLGYGSERSDHVGKLSPIAHVRAPQEHVAPGQRGNTGRDLDD